MYTTQWVQATEWIMLTSLSRQRPCHTIYLRTRHFFLLFSFLLTGANMKRSRWILPPSPRWHFDFSFPFPAYHSLIRSPHAITCNIQLHLLKRHETPLSIWNIVQTCCGSFSSKASVFTVQKSSPCLRCQWLVVYPGGRNLQQGLLIPCLFVLLLQFSKTRLSSLLKFEPPDEMINAKKYLFCWINSYFIPVDCACFSNFIVIAFLYANIPDCQHLNWSLLASCEILWPRFFSSSSLMRCSVMLRQKFYIYLYLW